MLLIPVDNLKDLDFMAQVKEYSIVIDSARQYAEWPILLRCLVCGFFAPHSRISNKIDSEQLVQSSF